jgi:hypothetical protein
VIASAHAEGVSIRKIAAGAGLGPTRVHAITREADLDGLDAALGELRSLYGWPAPEDPDTSRFQIVDRIARSARRGQRATIRATQVFAKVNGLAFFSAPLLPQPLYAYVAPSAAMRPPRTAGHG